MAKPEEFLTIASSGWTFRVYPHRSLVHNWNPIALVETALQVIRGTHGPLIRQSRHAKTYLVSRHILGTSAETDLFFKIYDTKSGLSAVLHKFFRRSSPRAFHVLRVCNELNRYGFRTPEYVLVGWQPSSGRSLLASPRVKGVALPEALLRLSSPASTGNNESSVKYRLEQKRHLLKALGHEIARLHRAGFIHGDLTPYNVFVLCDNNHSFIFLDNDRTVKTGLWYGRRQLRNLVQLGWRRFGHISSSDRMRFFHAYAASLGIPRPKRILRRVNAMIIARRLKNDSAQ